MIPLNLTKKEINRLSKRQVASRFTAWFFKNRQEINNFIEEKNLPELNQFKAYDKWLFFFSLEELEKQLPEIPDQALLLADTEYFLRSMCPVSLSYVDGKVICTRKEYEDNK